MSTWLSRPYLIRIVALGLKGRTLCSLQRHDALLTPLHQPVYQKLTVTLSQTFLFRYHYLHHYRRHRHRHLMTVIKP